MEFVLKLDNPLFYEEVAKMHEVVFAKLQTLEEMAYSWMDDVLEDAKKAFSNQSDLCILPKTPAAKQKGRRKKAKQTSARQLNTSNCSEDDYIPPKLSTKPTRPSRKRHVVDIIDSDGEESSSKASKLETSPVRRTRATSRAATTSYAKNTRANKKGKEKNKSRSQEPIKNLEKLIIEEGEQVKESDTSVCEVIESWTQPVSCATLAPEFAIKDSKSQCKTPIQNFNHMNVKEKAHAYEEIMLISDSPVTKCAKKSTSIIEDIQTPVKQSLSPHTPMNASILQTTPDTTIRTSDIYMPAIKLPDISDIENTPTSSRTDENSSKDSRRSIRKSLKALPSAVKLAAVNKEPEVKPARARTRLRLKKKDKTENVEDDMETVVPDDSNQSDSSKEITSQQNKRRTRSTGRDSGFAKDQQDKNEEATETMDTEDDLENEQESENLPLAAKSTRTKKINSAVERVKNDDKDSGVDDSGSSMETDGPLRVTRSKVRKPKTPDVSDNNVLASPAVPRATRTKTRKRQHEEESDHERRQPKRSCTMSVLSADENTPKQESSDIHSDEDVMGSPKSTVTKAGRPVPSFLNSLNKNSKNPIVQSHPNTDNVKSFIVRNSPAPKLNLKELQEKRRQELQEKQRKEQERLKKRDEENKKKMEEMRKKREEKMKKVQELKEHREQEERMNRVRIEKRLAEKRQLTQKIRDEKIKEDKEKQKMRLQKMEEAEERRKQEEEERRKKLLEQQEQEKFHEAMLLRKKEFEEQERLQKIEDEKRRAIERQQEIEREREKERDRLKKVEVEKHREWQKKKEEKEKQVAAERAERERMEFEKKRERELQLKKEMDRIKEQERVRIAEQDRLRNEERKRNEEIKKMVDKHNNHLNHSKPLPKPEFNKTHSLEEPTVAQTVNNDSYEMTPKRKPQASTAENYGIEDLNSGDETDDDECPRKKIPDWAQGSQLKTLLIRQHYNPPNLDAMFDVIEPPDLNVLFEKKKARFNKRTSSAHWDTPILKPGMLGRV